MITTICSISRYENNYHDLFLGKKGNTEPPFWILFTFWYFVTMTKTREPAKNLMQSALQKYR